MIDGTDGGKGLAQNSRKSLASYLLTPAFVACSTNAGEGPENHSALPIANMGHRMSERSSSDNLLELRKPLYSCTEERCHISTRSGMSLHMTQFYQAFSCIDTASDKCWGEKAWVQGGRVKVPGKLPS